MKYTITKEDISRCDFDERFKNIVLDKQSEFYSVCGKEHYRLLSYLSTLCNHSIIIDIGTKHSSIALSYNKTNTVYSFHSSELSNENIQYYKDNILDMNKDKNTVNHWKKLILSSSFIFLDVEPHNGIAELEFVNYLKEIGYLGCIICDDIWYFKEMRDNFWYKLQDQYKYDVTDIGHWSGTGIITFHTETSFDNYKYTNDNWTLVTAYFNLTKCYDASNEINARDQNYYISHSISTLSLPYNLVIYCDQESYEIIQRLRPSYLEKKTHYVIREFDEFQFTKETGVLKDNFGVYRNKIIENRKSKPYYFDNRNTASYYLFCMSRYIMLKETIELNPFSSTHFCWINFCIERMGFKNLIRLAEGLAVNRDKFSTCYIDYIPKSMVDNIQEYFQWGRCSMCSGFFTGNKEYMYKVCDLIENKFLEYLEKGYGHADEQLYSSVYFENPDLFEHYYGDYQQMVTNYKYIYDAPEPPIYNFITRSFQHKNYVKCYEACKFVLHSYILGKCDLSEHWLSILNTHYMKCKIQLQDIS
jgi:hypothetical protein